MEENIYVLYDKEAKIALKPLLVHRNDVAPLREIQEIAGNKDSLIHKHAGDFELLHIGVLNLDTLEIHAVKARSVANVIDLVADDQ